MLRYQEGRKTIKQIDRPELPISPTQIAWVHLSSSSSMKVRDILEGKQVHPLAIKSMEVTPEVPRVDIYKNHAFISTFTIEENLSTVPIRILVSDQYVISYAEKDDLNLFPKLEEDFRDHPEHMSHPGHVLYHILDRVSTEYLQMVDKIANEIQALEKQVFVTPFANEIGHHVYRWKGKVHELRQVVEAQENVIKTIGRSDFPYINEDSGCYFQDLKDNFSRVVTAFDTFRENFSSIFDLQMSLKSDHMNAIMKTLTLVSVIFIPMSFLAGLYGMNFEHMPELKWRYGYLYGLTLMFGLGLAIALYFRKKGWWGEKKNKGRA